MSDWRVIVGDCIEGMRGLDAESVNACVTSPPYFGLRDYGHDGQIGLEQTPEQFVARLVDVFSEVRRVLRDDGTLWVNMGDSYGAAGGDIFSGFNERFSGTGVNGKQSAIGANAASAVACHRVTGLRPKNLLGIPWRLAFALQADGWYLRQDIIWHKPNPMPESVTDRCTKAHEYIFLLSKSPRYYYDADAIKEAFVDDRNGASGAKPGIPEEYAKKARGGKARGGGDSGLAKFNGADKGGRNRRSVWTATTKPYSGAHFATFPPDLIEPCILAGCPAGGIVLDPFGGSGTTAGVAVKHGRNAILCELNPAYAEMMQARVLSIAGETPDMFREAAE